MGPLVTVITPVYNSAATLCRAYESLCSQTFTGWEYVIIDDGSTDHSPDLIRGLLGDARVRTARIANSGIGAAVNTGVRMSATPYVSFLDADDEYLPVHLEAHLAMMEADPSIDVCWGGVEVVTATPGDAYVPDIVKGYGMIHVAECVVQGTLFGRRAFFEQCPFTEDRSIWYQDSELIRRATPQYNVKRFLLPTYRYYRDSGQSMIDRIKPLWPVRPPNGLL